MFLAHVIQALDLHKEGLRALDLCAAPGGKSTLLRSLLHPDSFLLANEVVGSRVNLLEENLCKWGIPGYAISQSDPSKFGTLPSFFDLVLVDAPCSGEGMFRKDGQALAHWSLANVESCALRQKRILDEVWPALRPGGTLIYSTCTFNLSENEQQIADFISRSGAEAVELSQPYGGVSVAAGAGTAAFRFFPHRVQGEGFFVAVLRKTGHAKQGEPKARPLSGLSLGKLEAAGLTCTVDGRGNAFAVRPQHLALIGILQKNLNILIHGQPVGNYLHGKFKPGQGLAMLAGYPDVAPVMALSLEESLRFLQREDVYLAGADRGLVKVTYDGFGLGYAKAGGGRLVSQYPKHWRVRQAKREAYVKVVRNAEGEA
jgi:NOL1/NOP2/fmu family ribosome biogenesis protein/precorrin-6B methylase 2